MVSDDAELIDMSPSTGVVAPTSIYEFPSSQMPSTTERIDARVLGSEGQSLAACLRLLTYATSQKGQDAGHLGLS